MRMKKGIRSWHVSQSLFQKITRATLRDDITHLTTCSSNHTVLTNSSHCLTYPKKGACSSSSWIWKCLGTYNGWVTSTSSPGPVLNGTMKCIHSLQLPSYKIINDKDIKLLIAVTVFAYKLPNLSLGTAEERNIWQWFGALVQPTQLGGYKPR